MGMVRLTWTTFEFDPPIISLLSVKLGTLNFLRADLYWGVHKRCLPSHMIKSLANKWQYLRNSARQWHSCKGRLKGNRMWPIKLHHYLWPWMMLKVTFAVWNHSNSYTLGNVVCTIYDMHGRIKASVGPGAVPNAGPLQTYNQLTTPTNCGPPKLRAGVL